VRCNCATMTWASADGRRDASTPPGRGRPRAPPTPNASSDEDKDKDEDDDDDDDNNAEVADDEDDGAPEGLTDGSPAPFAGKSIHDDGRAADTVARGARSARATLVMDDEDEDEEDEKDDNREKAGEDDDHDVDGAVVDHEVVADADNDEN
jgi:hypothetical protein